MGWGERRMWWWERRMWWWEAMTGCGEFAKKMKGMQRKKFQTRLAKTRQLIRIPS
jgi:hypothetical protein